MSINKEPGWYEVEDDKFMHEDSGREVEIDQHMDQYRLKIRGPKESESRIQYKNYNRPTVESRVEHVMEVWNKLWDSKSFREAYFKGRDNAYHR